MADAFHIGFDDPAISGTLPVPDHPFERAPVAPAERPNPTDADWSHFPEARTSSKGPDGETQQPGPFNDFWTHHTGPQESPVGDMGDVVNSVAGGIAPAAPSAPAPAPTQSPPPATQSPPPPAAAPAPPPVPGGTGVLQPEGPHIPDEWLNPTTTAGIHQKQDIQALMAGVHAAWENDTIFGGLHNATVDATREIIDGAKAKLGAVLEDPFHGGYEDEAIQRVLKQKQAMSWGSYFNPLDPEGFFGGGAAYKTAIQKAQMDIFDEKRKALAERIQGDNAFDRAGENADALKLLDPNTPTALLGAKYSHAANMADSAAIDAAGGRMSAKIASFSGGMVGGSRDSVNDLALIFGGVEPTIAKTYFPLKNALVRGLSDVTEAGVRQATINMGITLAGEPEHQAANEARGEDHGLQPALRDLGYSALGGFIPGSFIQGVKSLHAIHGPSSQPWIDEFVRQARGEPPDGPMTVLGRKHMEEVHAWERERGLPEGSTYANGGSGLRTPTPTGGGGEEPGGPQKLLEGPRPYPASPDIPPESRNRPSPSSITPEAIHSAELDAASQPPRLPGAPPSETLRVYTEGVRHGEAPDVMAPPEPPMVAPPASDAHFLPPDHLPPTQGVVHRTTGYEGPHEDLLRNRVEHLEAQLQDPSLPARTAEEFRSRIATFSQHIENRNTAIEEGGIPAAHAAAIRGLQPGDVVTAKTKDGSTVTGEIGGWDHRVIAVTDHEGISHDVYPETVTNIVKGARGGRVNNVPNMAPGEVFAHQGKPVTGHLTF